MNKAAQYGALETRAANFDIVCLSHLRWDFVYQRPQHLLSRWARDHRVFYVEEPRFEGDSVDVKVVEPMQGVEVVVPLLPIGMSAQEAAAAQRTLIDNLIRVRNVQSYVLWYYTPMALAFTDHLTPDAVVYDCMDELAAFLHAPIELREQEQRLLAQANLIFTGGRSLYETRQDLGSKVRLFPSSVDHDHFRKARASLPDPADQETIPHPRLGFFGVIDERMDLPLIQAVAEARPDWHLVLIGPVVKIDEAALPRAANVHYLGMKSYASLPAYLANWDVAILPFARNDATRFISPTKTLEYLAAGKPVVSTPITDVVRPYGERGLVNIAEEPTALVAAVEELLRNVDPAWLQRVDAFLAQTSWERTWEAMAELTRSAASGRVSKNALATGTEIPAAFLSMELSSVPAASPLSTEHAEAD